MPNIPVRTILYFVVIIGAIVGLLEERRVRRERIPGQPLPLHIVTFRSATILSLLYGVIALGRTIWIWIDPTGAFAVRVLEDPPGNAVLAALVNGLVLTWLCTYVLYLYVRRHQNHI
jgi:hypothetical protein